MTLQSDMTGHGLAREGVAARRYGLDGVSRLLTLVIVALPVLFIAAVGAQPWIDPADLLRDPLAVAELRQPECCKVYYGAVSNLGVLVWMGGAAICLFAAAVVQAQGARAQAAVFLAAAGLLTGFLAIDDLFLVHENVLPALGVSEPVTYGAYGLLGLVYLAISWREILRHNVVLLFVGVALLGTSVVIDWMFHSEHPMRILLEDGAKLTGICAWVGFHVIAAWTILSAAAVRPARPDHFVRPAE